MMKILIIEDENPALKKLAQMVRDYDPAINIVGTTGSVKDTIRWLKNHPRPDLILLDIQLSDGLSLEIFKHVSVTCPVIFTTAYDQHILEAFNYNCIDYLLKPIKQEKLNRALDKYLKLKTHFTQDFVSLLKNIGQEESPYKQRITVKKGVDYLSVKTEDIAFFFTEYKLVFLITHKGEKYLADKTLSDLQSELNPAEFFRVNRKYLVHINAIARFKPYDKGRIEVDVKPPVREQIIISQEKAAAFREWVER
jgi:two-component system LytT family response regulator